MGCIELGKKYLKVFLQKPKKNAIICGYGKIRYHRVVLHALIRVGC